ncbi:MAG: hypothetical protein JWN41_135 [Thermoleophilia bacterium]|nr:hypothetical protein [Thermoleophilia bacterium]
MQIVSVAPVATSHPAAASAVHPDLRGIDVGVAIRRGTNWMLRTEASRENNVLGAARGYDSLKDAVAAARQLTAGTASAAAVFGAVDRFYLKQLEHFDIWNGAASLAPYDNLGGHKERAFTFKRVDVKALVDGDVVIRAGEVGSPVEYHA